MSNGRNGSLRVTSARRRWWPPGLPGQRRTMVRTGIALVIVLTVGSLGVAAKVLESGSNSSGSNQAAGSIAAPRPNAVRAATAKTGRKGQAGEFGRTGKASKAAPAGTRLVLIGPLPVVDTRGSQRLAANADVSLPLPKLPEGSTAVLAEVSVLEAAGAGAVTLTSTAGEITALRVPGAGAQLTTTIIVRIGPDARLRARVEGGGHLVVNLVGAFQPAETADSGRIVAIPATRALELVPAIDGHDAVIAVERVPTLAKAGLSAVLLQVSADVGRHGGFIQVGRDPQHFKQEFYWSATSGSDRVRDGFLVVPVTDGKFALHYKAGLRLRVEVVGYVTDDTAKEATAGLVVPVAPDPIKPVTVSAGTTSQVSIVGSKLVVPADRIAAAVLNVATEAENGGGMRVFAPGTDQTTSAALQGSAARPRSLVTLVGAKGGAVQLAAETRSIVTLTPQALILSR